MQHDNDPLMYNNTNNNNNLYAPYQSLALGAHVDHHDVVTIPFTETKAASMNGGIALIAGIICFFVTGALTGITTVRFWPVSIPIGILGFLATIFMFAGLKTIQPNSGLVCTLFGKYKGTEKTGGLRWMNPLYTVRTISLKLNNFETEKLKVNDKAGAHSFPHLLCHGTMLILTNYHHRHHHAFFPLSFVPNRQSNHYWCCHRLEGR
eukprot:GEZU01027471.1.p1 GENE.GEZU01027471.1~~GEZU01027471.1.p1  ORF type:complete len:207 (+),score=30.88 GEZU01027471.1:114-734(+)